MMDLMECKMRCSHQEGGLLWPLPRRYQLSEELTYDLGEFSENMQLFFKFSVY